MLDKAEAGSKLGCYERKQVVPPSGARSQQLILERQLADNLAECLGQARTDRTQLPVPKPSPVPLNGACPDAAMLGECLSKCGRSASSLVGTMSEPARGVFGMGRHGHGRSHALLFLLDLCHCPCLRSKKPVCLCLRVSLWNLSLLPALGTKGRGDSKAASHCGQLCARELHHQHTIPAHEVPRQIPRNACRLARILRGTKTRARLKAGRGQPEETSFICFKGGQMHVCHHEHGNAVEPQKLAKAKCPECLARSEQGPRPTKGLPIYSSLGTLRGRLMRMSSSSATESLHFQGMNFPFAPEACLKAKAKSLGDGMEESSRTSEGYFLRKSCFKANVFSGDLAGNVSCHDDAGSDKGCDDCPGGPAADGAGAGGGKPGAEGKGTLQVMLCALCRSHLRSANTFEGSPIKPKSVSQASN